MHSIRLVLVRAFLVCLVGCALGGSARAQAQAETEPGHVIVRWKTELLRRQLRLVAGRRVVHARPIGDGYWVYHLDERTPEATRGAIAALSRLPEVEVAEPNHIRRACKVPNDPLYPLLWNLRSANLEQAWDRISGSNVVVAVVDTGIRFEHPDLYGRTLPGYDMISDPTKAGDGDGPDPDANDAWTEDRNTGSGLHGTHVAGIIGAVANNKIGIAGVNWTCKILPVRVLQVKGGGSDADIAAGIRWAAGIQVANLPLNPTPARVINLSFGGPGYGQVLADAVSAAQGRGCIVVAAAGNNSTDVGGESGTAAPTYPAALPNVIVVGATDYSGQRASYWNYGAKVIVMAPGGDLDQQLPFTFDAGDELGALAQGHRAGVLSTLYNTPKQTWVYEMYSGTSQATPLVAGIVSLMLGIDPSLDSRDAIRILQATANPASRCPEGCGAGLVDADKALAMTAGKMPFGVACTSDAQCSDGVCRTVQGAGQICTTACTVDGNCPAGAPCTLGLCTPGSSQSQSCTGATCLTAGTVIGGCSVLAAATDQRAAWAGLPALVLLLGVALVLAPRLCRSWASPKKKCSTCSPSLGILVDASKLERGHTRPEVDRIPRSSPSEL